MHFRIVGAGLAGLLARRLLTTSGHTCQVFEKQDYLPNNHSAVLRFRSSIVGDATGIPFKKVRVMRAVDPWRNALADNLAYSLKATGVASMRSSLTSEPGLVDRYIAPPDFIQLLYVSPPVQSGDYHYCVDFFSNDEWSGDEPIISTIPMPILMDALQGPSGPAELHDFRSVPGFNVSFTLPGIDVYGSVYIPDPSILWNRVSITGNKVILEYSDVKPNAANTILRSFAQGPFDEVIANKLVSLVEDAMAILGLDGYAPTRHIIAGSEYGFSVKQSTYQKILPIDEDKRRRFMLWASEEHNIYSLGRFATWRPGLLLDDLVKDIRIIERMAAGDAYHRRIHASTAIPFPGY